MTERIIYYECTRLTIKSQVFEVRNPEEISQHPPPLLTNSIQVLKMVERGQWRVQQTKLQPPSQKRSVALECFGLSKVRFAGCTSVSKQGAQAPKGTVSGCRRICLARSDQSKDQPDKFLGRMRYGNVVMFSFGSFLCQV